MVFYNYILKCFVLIDLKTTRITHQDVGQMDMYIRMYDELKKSPDDNPTLGIVLCSETEEDIARYSILHGNEQLFASKYKLYLPTEEELREEIEAQKAVFYLQQKETEKQNKEENPLLLQEAHAMQKQHSRHFAPQNKEGNPLLLQRQSHFPSENKGGFRNVSN